MYALERGLSRRTEVAGGPCSFAGAFAVFTAMASFGIGCGTADPTPSTERHRQQRLPAYPAHRGGSVVGGILITVSLVIIGGIQSICAGVREAGALHGHRLRCWGCVVIIGYELCNTSWPAICPILRVCLHAEGAAVGGAGGTAASCWRCSFGVRPGPVLQRVGLGFRPHRWPPRRPDPQPGAPGPGVHDRHLLGHGGGLRS